jgi:uncharacterized protein YoxC
LRYLLLAQRDQFQRYLKVLDNQRKVLEQGSAEIIAFYAELAEKVLGDIFHIQKVIDPLESLYQAGVLSRDPEADSLHAELLDIKKVLKRLQKEVKGQIEENKELLFKRMTLLNADIKAMKRSPLGKRFSVYANPGTPSLVDLQW